MTAAVPEPHGDLSSIAELWDFPVLITTVLTPTMMSFPEESADLLIQFEIESDSRGKFCLISPYS